MAAKRKTLPGDFDMLIAEGNIDELKAVFDRCQLNAVGGYRKGSALSFRGVPDELVRWLVQQGADINMPDRFGDTPLHCQARYHGSNVRLFAELGADIHSLDRLRKRTPLHSAATHFNADAVKALLELKADPLALDSSGKNPMNAMLLSCSNINLAAAADIARLLIDAGTPIDEQARAQIKKLGQTFEFHRENFAPELLDAADAGLHQLYELFDVEPVPALVRHNGTDRITVHASTWQSQHAELWNILVPSQGKAATVQGEVIRLTGRLSYELLDNGGINWDSDYKKMAAALADYVSMGTPLSKDELNEFRQLVSCITKNDDAPARLTELGVGWVVLNPTPIPLDKTDYRR